MDILNEIKRDLNKYLNGLDDFECEPELEYIILKIDNFNLDEKGFTVSIEDIAQAVNYPMSLGQLRATLADVKKPSDNFAHLAGFYMEDTEDQKYVYCKQCETLNEESITMYKCAHCAGEIT